MTPWLGRHAFRGGGGGGGGVERGEEYAFLSIFYGRPVPQVGKAAEVTHVS